MTTLPLLALAGYFLILTEYIAMRHRDICAESDALIEHKVTMDMLKAVSIDDWYQYRSAEQLYWNRGTK